MQGLLTVEDFEAAARGVLSQLAYGVVFAIADSNLSNATGGARAATITSLLMLGVPETRALALVGDQP